MRSLKARGRAGIQVSWGLEQRYEHFLIEPGDEASYIVGDYVIPAGQRDMTRVERLVNLLRMQGIEIGRATSAVTLEEGTFPSGSFIIKRDQPYSRLAKTLLEKQVYPDPNLRTYDDASWTMGLMSHTDVKEIADKKILDLACDPVRDKAIRLPGALSGGGSLFAVAHYGSNNMITLRYRLKDVKVQATEKELKQGDVTIPPGSFVVSADAAKVRSAVEPLGLTAVGLSSAPSVPMHDLDLPRVAVYSLWSGSATQDVGWVRYAFDTFEVPYDLIYKERVKKGGLKDAYDVILMPSQGGSGKRVVFDVESRGRPVEYKKSERFRNLGMYGESEDITGGMGIEGVAELEKFVKAGGLLPGGVRAGAEGRRGTNLGAVLLAGRDHRRGNPAAGAPDLLRVREEDDSGAVRQRAAARHPDGRQPVRRAAAGTSADAAGGVDAVPGGRRSRAERADARRE